MRAGGSRRFRGGGQRLSAIEINPAKGGTTHPMLSMAVITEGRYDAATGTFVSGQGSPECYYATDNLHSDDYRGMSVSDLLDAAVSSRLMFDPGHRAGCVFHMLGALSE